MMRMKMVALARFSTPSRARDASNALKAPPRRKKRQGVLRKIIAMKRIKKALGRLPKECLEDAIFVRKGREVMIDIANAGIIY